MTESEIIAAIRRGIREPSARKVKDSDLSTAITRAIRVLGLEIEAADNTYYLTEDLLSSNTHVFSLPSDCKKVLQVWDIGTNAKDVTDATATSPIVITSASHGFSDDDIVKIFNVLGNTDANGEWKVANATTNTFELYGSSGTNAYTSGGKIIKIPSSDDGDDIFERIDPISPVRAKYNDDSKWLSYDKKIVINDPDFTNDILISYTKTPTEIDDIPTEYHDGIVAFGVINYIQMPKPEEKSYEDKMYSLRYYTNIWDMVITQIRTKLNFAIGRQYSTEKNYWI